MRLLGGLDRPAHVVPTPAQVAHQRQVGVAAFLVRSAGRPACGSSPVPPASAGLGPWLPPIPAGAGRSRLRRLPTGIGVSASGEALAAGVDRTLDGPIDGSLTGRVDRLGPGLVGSGRVRAGSFFDTLLPPSVPVDYPDWKYSLSFAEEALPLRGHVGVFQLGQFPQDSLVLGGQLLGHLDVDLDQQVAAAAGAWGRACRGRVSLKTSPVCVPAGIFNSSRTVERGHFDRRPPAPPGRS